MREIILKNHSLEGIPMEVTFLPELGMNMASFRKGGIEAIDQATKVLFDERYAGLGALIGPHFHHRNPAVIPPVKDEALFTHIARVRTKGVREPFSHGIARYAPWKAEATSHTIKAMVTGKDVWNGVPLADLEGQNFSMSYQADLQPDGLHIAMSIVSDTDSLVGLHYYYYLPQGRGTVVSTIQDTYIDSGQRKNIPQEWACDGRHLVFPMELAADYTFYPYPNPCQGKIELTTDTHRVVTEYECNSQENAWQLYHPAGATYVCIEPLSAQDPRHPNLTVSSLKIRLSIETY